MIQRKVRQVGYTVFGSAKFTIFEAVAMSVALELIVSGHWFATALWCVAAAFGSKFAENYFTR